MAKIEWDTGTHKGELEYAYGSLLPGGMPLTSLTQAFWILDQALELSAFHFARRPDGAYDYTFTAADGRVWRQVIEIPAPPAEATVSFAVEDLFTLAEFKPHRDLRLIVIDLVRRFGVTRIELEGSLPG